MSAHVRKRRYTKQEERSIRRGERGKASVSATRESALFTFLEAFATLYTLHRAIICVPGANTPPMLRLKGYTRFPFETRGSVFHHRAVDASSSRFRWKRDRAEKEQWLWQNNEAQDVAPLKTRLMRPSRLNGGSLPGVLFSTLLFTPLPLRSSLSSGLRSGNGTTIPEPASIYVSIIIVLR